MMDDEVKIYRLPERRWCCCRSCQELEVDPTIKDVRAAIEDKQKDGQERTP